MPGGSAFVTRVIVAASWRTPRRLRGRPASTLASAAATSSSSMCKVWCVDWPTARITCRTQPPIFLCGDPTPARRAELTLRGRQRRPTDERTRPGPDPLEGLRLLTCRTGSSAIHRDAPPKAPSGVQPGAGTPDPSSARAGAAGAATTALKGGRPSARPAPCAWLASDLPLRLGMCEMSYPRRL